MKTSFVGSLVLSAALLSACGGNDATQTDYPYVTPTALSQRVYSRTIVDNSNSTIDQNYTITVTAVNANGSYSTLQEDPTHTSTVVNGTDYSIPTETANVDSTGHDISFSYMAQDASTVECVNSPYGAGPVYPLTVGENWTLAFTQTCSGDAAISYMQTGIVSDIEMVTVPAGTFSALKLQSTLVWTNTQGTTRTQTITNWRNVQTLTSVKQVSSFAVSGTAPANGYPVSEVIELQSGS